jgi:hypothetical protein
MPARDVSAGVDHHHQDGTDSKRGEVAAAADGGTDREHQEERADYFGGYFAPEGGPLTTSVDFSPVIG